MLSIIIPVLVIFIFVGSKLGIWTANITNVTLNLDALLQSGTVASYAMTPDGVDINDDAIDTNVDEFVDKVVTLLDISDRSYGGAFAAIPFGYERYDNPGLTGGAISDVEVRRQVGGVVPYYCKLAAGGREGFFDEQAAAASADDELL